MEDQRVNNGKYNIEKEKSKHNILQDIKNFLSLPPTVYFQHNS